MYGARFRRLHAPRRSSEAASDVAVSAPELRRSEPAREATGRATRRSGSKRSVCSRRPVLLEFRSPLGALNWYRLRSGTDTCAQSKEKARRSGPHPRGLWAQSRPLCDPPVRTRDLAWLLMLPAEAAAREARAVATLPLAAARTATITAGLTLSGCEMLHKIAPSKREAQSAKALCTDLIQQLVRFNHEPITLVGPMHRAATRATRPTSSALDGTGRRVDDEVARAAPELAAVGRRVPSAAVRRGSAQGTP
jgi:hypothetical protein